MLKFLLICLLLTILTNCQHNIVTNTYSLEPHGLQQKPNPADAFKIPLIQKHHKQPQEKKNLTSTESKLANSQWHKNQLNHTHGKNHTWTKLNDSNGHHNRTINKSKPHQEQSKFDGVFKNSKNRINPYQTHKNQTHKNQTHKNQSSSRNHWNKTQSARQFNQAKPSNDHKGNANAQSHSNKPKGNHGSSSHPQGPRGSSGIKPQFKLSCKTDQDCKNTFPRILYINSKIVCNVNTNQCQFN